MCTYTHPHKIDSQGLVGGGEGGGGGGDYLGIHNGPQHTYIIICFNTFQYSISFAALPPQTKA